MQLSAENRKYICNSASQAQGREFICFTFYKYTNVYILFSSLKYTQKHTYPSVAQQIFHRMKFLDNAQIKATKILCMLQMVTERVRN